jgi:hypothetical protein
MSKDLINKIIEASDAISKASRNGQGNYIVINPSLEIPLGKVFKSTLGITNFRIDKINRIKNKLKEYEKDKLE